MSGPKVVRVVTREELFAICEELLRQLDREVARWTKAMLSDDLVSAEDEKLVKDRQSALRTALSEGRFAEVRRNVPLEIQFLQEHVSQRYERRTQATYVARQKERSRRDAASTLLDELRKQESIEGSAIVDLEAVRDGKTIGKEADAILAKAIASVSQVNEAKQPTETQRSLAEKLRPSSSEEGARKWQMPTGHPNDTRFDEIERKLAECAQLFEPPVFGSYVAKLQDLEKATTDSRLNLRIDTLVLDLAGDIARRKEEIKLIDEASDIVDEFNGSPYAFDETQLRVQERLKNSLTAKDMIQIVSLITQGRAALDAAKQRHAASLRRETILRGLASLGYEVREGMTTAWIEQGRIILRKPSVSGYGVELAGAPDADRMQVRVVAFEEDRDKADDRNAESTWCGEFGGLQELVKKSGGALTIERALGVGAVPIKEVADYKSPQEEGMTSRKSSS